MATMIELWAGVQLKLNHAAFHLEKMERALDPPERTHMNVALEAAGALLGTSWERPFYAHVDAFLSATRSIPEVIQSCFGEDKGAPTAVKQWFAALPAAEQNKRQQFTAQFKPHYDAFRALPLGTERHKTEHRIGYPGVTVTMMGRFGATYVGSPVQSVPTSETRNIEAGDDTALLAIQANQRPIAVRPTWQDFTIDSKPLFDEFRAYLQQAQQLVSTAQAISQSVHGSDSLTMPP